MTRPLSGRLPVVLALVVGVALLIAAPAHAASQQNDKGWEKVDATAMMQPGETMPASKLVAAAYGFIWVMVLGFVGFTWQRARQVETELDELKSRIERAGK